MSEVVAVNRDAALALMDDGSTMPITNWIGDSGDESDAADAIICVAGPDAQGFWHSVDLRDFQPVSTQ